MCHRERIFLDEDLNLSRLFLALDSSLYSFLLEGSILWIICQTVL